MDQKAVLDTITDILLPYWSLCKKYTEQDNQVAKRAFIDAILIATNSKPPQVHESVFVNGFTMEYLHNLRKIYKCVKSENYLSACHLLSDTLDLYWTEDLNNGLLCLLEEIKRKETK